MKVTFDTNVWRRLVNEGRSHLVEIKNKISDGKIQAYICEITVNLEAIRRQKRAEFFKSYKPKWTVEDLPPENEKLRMSVGIGPNTELHPGLPAELKDDLLKAHNLGFRVLRMTNIGTVRTKEISDNMYVQHDDLEEFWTYAELLANCNDFIVGLGCGQAEYDQFKARSNEGQTIPPEQWRKFSEAIAEWVDGEALSAHYATGNDFFCTNDKARNAGTGSIFHNQNRTRLEKKFGIRIISSCEAAHLC